MQPTSRLLNGTRGRKLLKSSSDRLPHMRPNFFKESVGSFAVAKGVHERRGHYDKYRTVTKSL